MTEQYRRFVRELLAIFAGRDEVVDIGQFSAAERRRLAWAEKHYLLVTERRPWPGPVVGTCVKTCTCGSGFDALDTIRTSACRVTAEGEPNAVLHAARNT